MANEPLSQGDPIITKYFDLIEANMPGVFKGKYYGDPIRIPASKLPALVASRKATMTRTLTGGSTGEDQHDMQIVFTIVTDIRKDISDDSSFVPGIGRLYDIIEGRDPTTLLLKPTSLMQILRHNLDVNGGTLMLWTDVSTPTKVEYGMTIAKRAEDSWAIEGTITIIAKLVQLR